jgi:hypothetical protein
LHLEAVQHIRAGEVEGDRAPNTKGNFQFDRVVTGWRGIPLLDLRHKT